MVVYEGPETRHFLQGQLSCDTEKLENGHWCWGGYLTLKGRLVSTFVAIGLGDESIGLVMDKQLVEPLVKKLKMYQLRAKTKPSVSDLGVFPLIDDSQKEPDPKVQSNANGHEQLIILGNGAALGIGGEAGSEDVAGCQLACAEAGMPWLSAPLLEKLTVHNISLDLAGGVDFDKGCYLGQEIVIRSHHRGMIKSRAYVVSGKGNVPERGMEILSEIHGGQVAGQFIYGASSNGTFTGLAALRKDAAKGQIELGDGRDIDASPPPYGLVDEKFEKN